MFDFPTSNFTIMMVVIPQAMDEHEFFQAHVLTLAPFLFFIRDVVVFVNIDTVLLRRIIRAITKGIVLVAVVTFALIPWVFSVLHQQPRSSLFLPAIVLVVD